MELLNELTLEEQIKLVEDVSWDPGKPLDGQLKQAIFQLEAARRALGLANQLSNPESRKKHRSRIMGMLNVLRSSLNRLCTAIDAETEAMQR